MAAGDPFFDAMNDDFNTPLALQVIDECLSSLLAERNPGTAEQKLASVRVAQRILGIDFGID
jgi:cysteinyl-tRNA synthetase